MISLPRQARDKHRESTQEKTRFCRKGEKQEGNPGACGSTTTTTTDVEIAAVFAVPLSRETRSFAKTGLGRTQKEISTQKGMACFYFMQAVRSASAFLPWTRSKRWSGTLFFECFPYVCPEPVLVKRSLLYINGAKSVTPSSFSFLLSNIDRRRF
eukprot:COSAG06_NODE_8098_length_2273_cov_6.646734_2_plen_155_part_00